MLGLKVDAKPNRIGRLLGKYKNLKDLFCTVTEMPVDDQKNGIRILNHTQGDIVCYPLVLLAGTITKQGAHRDGQFGRLLETSVDAGSGRPDKVQVLDGTRVNSGHIEPSESTLLVSCKDHQMSWPVIEGGFKVVVPLSIGDNLIKLTLKINDAENVCAVELKLTYTPLTLPRWVCAFLCGSSHFCFNVFTLVLPYTHNCFLKKKLKMFKRLTENVSKWEQGKGTLFNVGSSID